MALPPTWWSVGVIIFGSVWFLSKKIIKPKFFFEKKTETGSNRPVSVRFGFFRAKTGLARFGSVFSGFGSVFSGFGSVFSVWLGFFPVFCRFGSVRFFRFFVYKTETEPNWPVFSKN
jgi:hypothetical protein